MLLEYYDIEWVAARERHCAVLVPWGEVERALGRAWTGVSEEIAAIERLLYRSTGVWWLNAEDAVETSDGLVFVGPSYTALTLIAMYGST